jgi:protein-S-isoprenylcysteine O-methyltransferase Ste14
MAMGSFAQGIAVGLMLGSPLVVAYALAGAVGWNYVVRPWEEMDLVRRFGPPYARYRDSVRCWLPRLRPYPDDN